MDIVKSSLPKLRFPEFSEDWELKKLGEITDKVSVKNKESKQYPIYSINNINGFVPQGEQFEGMDSNERGYDISLYKIIDKNTFAYNPARINVGSIGYSYNLTNIIVSSLYVCFKTKETIEDKFLYQYLKSEKFNKNVQRNTEGGVRQYLFYENFSIIKNSFPTLPEQQKIASFLTAVDDKIQQLTKKKELLEKYKKGVMQKIFPSTSSGHAPEIRFKPALSGAEVDDDGNDYPDWEEKKMEEIATFFSGGTPTSTNKNYYNGNIPFIGSGDISNLSVNQYITKEALKNSSAKMVNIGDLLYALYGATSGEVAISKINGAINQAILCIRTKNNETFLFHWLSFMKARIISTFLQGGQGNLSAQIIKKLKLRIPSESEQQKIADFLSSIDKKIDFVNTQIEKTKEFKKGLLQQMFV